MDVFARRLQVQERLTDQIADAVMEVLQPDRRRRGHRGGALLHDDARGGEAELPHGHQRAPGHLPRRLQDPGRVPPPGPRRAHQRVTALAGRLALVTGASRGIGAATARALAECRRPGGPGGAQPPARSSEDATSTSLRPDRRRRGRRARGAGAGRAKACRPSWSTTRAASCSKRSSVPRPPSSTPSSRSICGARSCWPGRSSRHARGGRRLFISVGSVADHTGFPENAAYARQQVRTARAARDARRGVPGHRRAPHAGLSRGRPTRRSGIRSRPEQRPGFPSRERHAAARRRRRGHPLRRHPAATRARGLDPAAAVRPRRPDSDPSCQPYPPMT